MQTPPTSLPPISLPHTPKTQIKSMAETQGLVSNKRKRSSHPFMGTSTRSKSQIYLHCNRSGRARSDTFSSNQAGFDSKKKTQFRSKKKEILDSAEQDDRSCVFIKDLRIRRVFSLPENDHRLRVDDCKDSELMISDSCNAEDDKNERFHDEAKLDENARNFSREQNSTDDLLVEVSNLNEECVQATPPDAEMVRVDNNMECVMKSDDLQDNSIDKKIGNSSALKSGVNPWSRVRVFKAPGSLSYRRLLPYLMDIVQDQATKLAGSTQNAKFPNIECRQTSVGKTGTVKPYMEAQTCEKVANSSVLICLEKDNSNKSDSPALLVDDNIKSSTLESSSLDGSPQVIGYPDGKKPLDNSLFNTQDANEQSITMTRPDADIFGKVFASQNSDQVLEKPLNGSTHKINGYSGDNRMDSPSKRKWGLYPCSRPKLFKTKSSFNYRRMLPVLMDFAKDFSDNSGNVSCPKLEKCSQENQVSPLSSSQLHETPVETLNDRGLRMKNDTDSCSLEMSSLPCSNHPSSSNEQNLVPCDHNIDSHVSIGSQQEMEAQVTVNLSKSPVDVNDNENMKSSTLESSSPSDSPQVVGYFASTNPSENSPCNAQDANKKSIKMTRPNADIFGKAVVSQNADQVTEKPINGNIHKINDQSGDNGMESSSKRILDMYPCPRSKLFKTRSSFNYRRMLPVLMDIAKDYSGLSGDNRNVSCPKLEKSPQESQVSPSFSSELQEIPEEKLNDKSFHMKHDTDPSSSNEPNPTPSDHNTVSPVSIGSQQETEARTMVNLSENKNSESLELSVSPLPVSGDIREVSSLELSANNFSQELFKLEAFVPLGIPANGLSKSILRRHPRGCRGLCTCLKCASFHLHAERAFEFSKNQMQDAEEIALDLIKELSHVRNMLEKAAPDSNDNLVLCNNQVNEACRKASQAEELAKAHLNQMKYDLSIHCRISDADRPRVTFADNV
ncbi:uncharacterized protein LOC126653441 [Mercurialis annua]|uniref:uncharacterized protein LOC126653441 n=1 Tax=Mercurialis annua TaxID=3986 RepID=UPI00215E6B32|nr:uncharacterized protein LOC126653441 [Mercurialis annua]